jgi:hypothetical protein|nr:hypothetical protein [Kofleriaceae bacterium]
MRGASAAVALAALAGCVTNYVHLGGHEVRVENPDVPHGARITSVYGQDVDAGPDTVVDTIDDHGQHHSLRLSDAYAGCDVDTTKPCALDKLSDLALPHREMNPKVKSVAITVVSLGLVGGLVGCTFECDSPYNYLSGGTLVVGALVLVVGTYLIVESLSHMD